MATLTVGEREYRVVPMPDGKGYLLHGAKRAVYAAIRWVKDPSLLHVVNTNGNAPKGFEHAWFTDCHGQLEWIHAQRLREAGFGA